MKQAISIKPASAQPVFQVSIQTEAAQAAASDPATSVWVSANAGSGKTTVLVRRVLRLLLAGVNPAKIVCLTYTKAAAANMKIRLFSDLREWTSLPEAELSGTLAKLSGTRPSHQMLARARTLFALALETPGGLKIDTIHGFCTRLLQSAPFEANVPASFDILQDAAAIHLTHDAVRDVLGRAGREPESALGQAMHRVAQDTEETGFEALTRQILANRAVMTDQDGMLLPLARLEARILGALDISSDVDEAALAADFIRQYVAREPLDMLRLELAKSSKKDVEQGDRIARVLAAHDATASFEALFEVFFTTTGTARAALVTKPFARANPALAEMLLDMAEPFQKVADQLKSIEASARSLALTRIAHAVITRVEALKSRHRLLDFEDIILRTRSLLTRVDASWVLYRLDAGIEHVLIDEAQDTSGAQWDILKAITAEFFAGRGAAEHTRMGQLARTIFAVGDEKQSIYSFQKAEPAAFDEMRSHFSGKIAQLAETGHQFRRIQLDQSFRSTREVMEGVDLIFGPMAHHKGLVFEKDMGAPAHNTARLDGVGSIDLWPLEADDGKMERDAWDDPVDAISSAGAKLAMRIAKVLKTWTDAGFDDLGRPFRPGDVLILLRKRSGLFQAIVRELKQAGVPVAGVDRLDIASHVAVEDMIALAEAALLPADDLTLAMALKTPVHGLDDTHLMQLAPGRTGSLRAAVGAAAAHDPVMQALDHRLGVLELRARSIGPFGFFARLLGPEGGRRAMLSRLGEEAGDALDAFLSMALDYERKSGPSLSAFLNEMKAAAQEIKRDLADDNGEVRVMTVHGAKGLEAPVVIIPDLGEPQRNAARVVLYECPVLEANMQVVAPLWVPRKSMHAIVTQAAKAKADEAQDDERRRLFYVALTRARDRIILCGAQAKGVAKPGSWYDMARTGLGEKLEPAPSPHGQDDDVQRFQLNKSRATGEEADSLDIGRPAFLPAAHVMPGWINQLAPQLPDELIPLAPSRLRSRVAAGAGGDEIQDAGHNTGQDMSGGTEGAMSPSQASRLLAGQLAHRLLQHLPSVASDERRRVATALAGMHGSGVDLQLRTQIAESAVSLLERSDLQALFGPDSLAEVAISGDITLPDGTIWPVAGRIDRLAVEGRTVWIADYKTGHSPQKTADIKLSTLSQIAAYHALVEALYPASLVRSLVIYLGNGMALEPSPEQRMAAFVVT